MDEKELLKSFQHLQAEQDTLRARCDALTIALKRVIRNSHDPAELTAEILRALEKTSELGLASLVSDSYLTSLDAMKARIARWQ